LFPYTDSEAERVGYDCGYTYRTGGRPQLTPEQQVQVASDLAQGCCSSLKSQQTFVVAFQRGYRKYAAHIQGRNEARIRVETYLAAHEAPGPEDQRDILEHLAEANARRYWLTIYGETSVDEQITREYVTAFLDEWMMLGQQARAKATQANDRAMEQADKEGFVDEQETSRSTDDSSSLPERMHSEES
jgi:hypothetical protein